MQKNLKILIEKYIIKTVTEDKILEEMVIALLMIVNQEIKEHRIQPSMSVCLKGARVAKRESKERVQYQCIKSLAETEIYLGEKSIVKLILKQEKNYAIK